MTRDGLVCAVCRCPVQRSWFDRGPRRRWVHVDPTSGRPVAADHAPQPA